MRPVLSVQEPARRLLVIYPRPAFGTVMPSPLAGAAITAMLYVDSVSTRDDDTTLWFRP